jgi:hypothetical protein
MGSLFVLSYSLALGDPVPYRIDAALVGDPAGQARTVDSSTRATELYFPADQHVRPIAVLATWAIALFAAMLLVSHRLRRSPGDP